MSREWVKWFCEFAVVTAVSVLGMFAVASVLVRLVQHHVAGAVLFSTSVVTACIIINLCLFRDLCTRRPSRARAATAHQHGGHTEQRREDGSAEPRHVYSVDAIVAYKHQQGEGNTNGQTECTICLGDVESGDTVKRLPFCVHLFHAECIDKWLATHTTCPACRCNVFAPLPSDLV